MEILQVIALLTIKLTENSFRIIQIVLCYLKWKGLLMKGLNYCNNILNQTDVHTSYT